MKVVIVEPSGVEERKLLAMVGEAFGDRVEIVYHNTKTTDTAEFIERRKDAEIIVVSNLPLNVQVIGGCRSLRPLAVTLTSVGHIAIGVCRKSGIMVYNCAGYSACAMADLVFSMLISLYRDVIPCDKVCREEGAENGLVGFELEGKTFGMVGTGAIGLRVVTIAQAFGYRVLAYSKTARDVPGARYADLEALLAECDAVSLRTPLTEKTKELMNEERIGLMKRNAVFVGTTRGPVVDSDALAKAPKEGRTAGVCIDVFESEPPVREDHPLFSAPNTIMMPHVAFAARKTLVKQAIVVFDNVTNYLDGAPGNVIG